MSAFLHPSFYSCFGLERYIAIFETTVNYNRVDLIR